MGIEVTVKKWGNSMGIILSKQIVEKEKLNENDKISIQIIKEANFKNVFGSLKRKMSGQQMKDLVRQGWEN
ncbi:hypothetical protein HYU23_01560 [Candidatus Woesearchaeota archaeon]|nr:hypothetical protein [Candidatus Woesearchaeota archaeon]